MVFLFYKDTKTTFYEENSPTTIKALEKQAAREGRRPNQTIEQEILKFIINRHTNLNYILILDWFFPQLRQLSLDTFTRWLTCKMRFFKVFWIEKIWRGMVFEGKCVQSRPCTLRVRRKWLISLYDKFVLFFLVMNHKRYAKVHSGTFS